MRPVFSLPPGRVNIRVMSIPPAGGVPWHVTERDITRYHPVTKAGEGVRIAVLDTGCDIQHPETQGVIEEVISVYGDNGLALNPHGQHCIGLIAGKKCGYAPKAKIISIKVLSDAGTGDEAMVAQGMRIAIDKKVDMISMSLGSPVLPPVFEAACRAAAEAGIIIVAASGNDCANKLGFPAGLNECVLSVGAVDKTKKRAFFSNFDASRLALDLVDYGVDIFSSVTFGGYQLMSGTSQATPLVTGFIANYISLKKSQGLWAPGQNVASHYNLLRQVTEDLGQVDRDNEYGWGMLNAAKAFSNDFAQQLGQDAFKAW